MMLLRRERRNGPKGEVARNQIAKAILEHVLISEQKIVSRDARSSVDSLGIAMQVSAETEMGFGYSINSCALIRIDVGRVMPSDFAARALTISSRSVGSSIGMSPGLVPFNILSIK